MLSYFTLRLLSATLLLFLHNYALVLVFFVKITGVMKQQCTASIYGAITMILLIIPGRFDVLIKFSQFVLAPF